MRKTWKVSYVYLRQQFADSNKFFRRIQSVVASGDFTLGKQLVRLESRLSKILNINHVIGVNSGTDALLLPLKALGIGPGDEVITAPNSFVASAAVIALCGARPVFVDVRDDYTIDPTLIVKAITKRAKAIIPVHLTGQPADMQPILDVAYKHNLFVIEDCAQAIFARYDGKYVGTLGTAGAFSFHPLKILNIWGDGGFISTGNAQLAQRLRLWRNHGLKTRETVEFFAHNSRLDSVQAAVANTILPYLSSAVAKREKIAHMYDTFFQKLEPFVHVPNRHLSAKTSEPVFTNYVVQVQKREELVRFLTKRGIEVVIQYPIPIHLQKAAGYLGYKKGDFPVCERQADTILTLPCNQYLTKEQVNYVCKCVGEFYR